MWTNLFVVAVRSAGLCVSVVSDMGEFVVGGSYVVRFVCLCCGVCTCCWLCVNRVG